MKKLISLLLAVSVMAASTVASAAGLGADGQQNPGTWEDVAGKRDSNSLRDYRTYDQLACYRPGDTITFKINQTNIDVGSGDSKVDYSFNAGDVITFISSIDNDSSALNSATVMFIDQVVADNASMVSYSYKIREGLAEGRYKLDIKIGDIPVDTYYYGVIDPKVDVVYVDEAETEQFKVVDGTAYYFAKATVKGNFYLEQAGVKEFGFDFGEKTAVTGAATADAYFGPKNNKFDNDGMANWFFHVGITDVAGDLPDAEGVVIYE